MNNVIQPNFKVINLTMMETGTYNPVYNRPYVSTLDGVTLDNLNKRIENTNSQSVHSGIFAGLGINILSPSAAPGDQIMLPNGWDTKRVRFLLTIKYTTRNGNDGYYYFQGFTDFDGVTNSGAIAPDMTFYINSFAKVGTKLVSAPSGAYMTMSVLETGQIINSRIIYDYVDSEVYSMRPYDVFKGMEGRYIVDGFGEEPNGVIDTRVIVRDNEISTRNNNIPNNYLTDILGTYKTSVGMSYEVDSDKDIFSTCISQTRQNTVLEIEPLRALASIANFGDGSVFKMSDLEVLDPEISNVINYLRMGKATQLHQVGQSEYWNGANYSTVAATIISNAIPALMMELMINRIHFRATNMDAGGKVNVVIIDAVSMTPTPIATNLEIFKNRLANEVLLDISYNNEEVFTLEVISDIYSETKVSISIGNEAVTEYVMPTFCDSLTSPVLTTGRNNFYNLVDNFESTINTLSETFLLNQSVMTP